MRWRMGGRRERGKGERGKGKGEMGKGRAEGRIGVRQWERDRRICRVDWAVDHSLP
jgi:hypothetical protein